MRRPEAHSGHRTVDLPGPNGELFYGWYLSIAVMVRDENGPPAAELARRMTVCSCARDPARVLAAVLLRMPGRHPARRHHRRLRLRPPRRRSLGHPAPARWRPAGPGPAPARPRPRGTHQGAVIANGSLYCPQTPRTLLELAPLPPAATAGQTAVHDQQTAELARCELAGTRRRHRRLPPGQLPRHGRQDPLPAPPGLDAAQPGPARILARPGTRPPAATQRPITVPAQVAARTSPGTRLPIHRLAAVISAAPPRRRPAPIKTPPATTSPAGWCRLTA